MAENGKTLLILAAGIGRRFGGLKQAAAVGPYGETILDYSVYDARKAGFRHAVCVIRPEMEQDFRASVLRHLEKMMEVKIVHQTMRDLAETYHSPLRQKPWGTGHAVLAARRIAQGKFAVINADDFYGPKSFELLAQLLKGLSPAESVYGMVAFRLGQTLSEHGPVARGVCAVSEQGELSRITEFTHIMGKGSVIRGQDISGREHQLDPQAPVSMNMWAFSERIFRQLELLFREFVARRPSADEEFYISESMGRLLERGRAKVRVALSPERWCGITHPDDLEVVRQYITGLIGKGVYPAPLWA